MSDQVKATGSAPEGGQPSGEPEPTGQPAQPAKQEALTPDVVQRLIDERLNARQNDIIEQAFRRSQSYSDSTSAKIRQQVESIDKQVQYLESMGVQLTPGQKEQMRMRAWQDAMLSTEPDPQSPANANAQQRQPGQQPQPPQDYAYLVDQVKERTNRVLRENGMTWDDPALAGLNFQNPDPLAFYLDFMSAVNAASQSPEQPSNQQPNPLVRTPGIGGGEAAGNEERQILDRLAVIQKNPSRHMAEIGKLSRRLEEISTR